MIDFFGDIEMFHEFFYTWPLFGRNRFQRKAKILMRPVGQSPARRIPGAVAILIHARDSGADIFDFLRISSNITSAQGDLLTGPLQDSEIESTA